MGIADAGRIVWRVADNLEKTLLCYLFFEIKKDTYVNKTLGRALDPRANDAW